MSHLEHFLAFVEWPQVLEAIAGRTASSAGSLFARDLVPSAEPDDVRGLQRRTREALDLARLDRVPDLSPIASVSRLYERADRLHRGLTSSELRALAVTLTVAADARVAFRDHPALLALVGVSDEAAVTDAALASEILAKVGPYGALVDDASDALANIRDSIRGARQGLRAALQVLIQDPAIMVALAEFRPLDFEGHPCLKVKARDVRRVPGPILGETPDGAVLVEPDAAREHLNRIRHLEVDERAEVHRIVRDLTERVLPHRSAHERIAQGLVQADVHVALARYALDLGLNAPEEAPAVHLDLRGARHPLLAASGACVPLDVELSPQRRILVISGPNGGGKTVAMKTIALAAALAQIGSYVPAAAGSRLPIFPAFLAVAEPVSSVQAGLSTFQAHARELAGVAADVVPGALVLLDELGLGTDPAEAAAIGQAFLEDQLERGVLALATTHLGPLKTFAARTPGVINGSVGLDAAGHPTFALVVGTAGRSYALEVARAAGLPEAICARAEALHGGVQPAERGR